MRVFRETTPNDERQEVRVVVVVNWRRGTVYGVTTDNEEARRWTRDLCDQEQDGLAATMTVALVDPGPR